MRLSRIGCVFLLLALACSDDPERTTVELLNDPIEEFNSWYFVKISPAKHQADVDQRVAASPSYSLAIRSSSAETEGFSYWEYFLDRPTIPVGSSLTLKVKVKTDDVTGKGAYIALRGDKASTALFFVTTEDRVPINGTQDFTEYSVKLDKFPEGVTAIYIFLILDAKSTGFVHFDDVVLENEF